MGSVLICFSCAGTVRFLGLETRSSDTFSVIFENGGRREETLLNDTHSCIERVLRFMATRFNTIASIEKSITTIVILSGVNEERFEQFMKDDVFPSVNLATRLFEIRRHVLLKSDKKVDGRSQYVWTVFATTTDELQGDNHLADVLTRPDTRAELTAKLKPYGTLLAFLPVHTDKLGDEHFRNEVK